MTQTREYPGAFAEEHHEPRDEAEPKVKANGPDPQPIGPPLSVDETLAIFDKWLILPDRKPVLAVLGTVAANLLPGDAVWTGVIGPPSSAKTEILNSVSLLPDVVQAATLTPASLLSGTPKRQRDKGAKGGLLRGFNNGFGIIALKDFGSILSMRPDMRPELLAALREIYDGEWTRHLGIDGGLTLHWKGKVGLVFASTAVIDSHYALLGAMGDRFLMSRFAPVSKGQFGQALKHAGPLNKAMRAELAQAVARLFSGRRAEPAALSENEIKQLDDVITLAVKLRGAVERDRYTREIEQVYGAEGTARLGLALVGLLNGLDVLGVDRATALDVIESVALDSVPPIRRKAYEYICREDAERELIEEATDPEHPDEKVVVGSGIPTTAVAKELGLPSNTVRRALEDLAAYRLACRTSQGPGKADLWNPT
jgi:hypothetical protein